MRIALRSSGWLAALALALPALDVPVRAEGGSSTPRSAAQLDQLVAPIALYPDPLLAQVLMAATYPPEVAESAHWSQANVGVTGEALEDAMQKEAWDPSVKGLTAVPQVLQMMNDKLDCARHGHSRQAYLSRLAMAERLCGTADRHGPAGVRRPPDRARGGPPA